jgi:glycosyltransferase involved in cell wall biosynthesis
MTKEESYGGVQLREEAAAVGPDANSAQEVLPPAPRPSSVALLTGGADKPYALGLASCLISEGVAFDFVGSDAIDGPELHHSTHVRFLNLRGDQRPDVGIIRKLLRIVRYYVRLICYGATAKPKVFHILWNNKLEVFDRTLLLLYYRVLGKRIAFTAHNVNAARRDGNDTVLNRLTLRVQYRMVDHIFVHTERMKRELRTHFGVSDQKTTVIPFGMNSTVPNTALTSVEARQRLGLIAREKAVLFFGNIAPYKGLEYLVEAMEMLARTGHDYRLIIVGSPNNYASYWEQVQQQISRLGLHCHIIERIEFVPDEDTEIYFKCADVLVLPYTHISQSGVLVLGYNFGLPVIASDVGSFREDILEGRTGYVFRPRDPADLAKTIEVYFSSALFRELENRREEIRAYANDRFSWNKAGEMTKKLYEKLLAP